MLSVYPKVKKIWYFTVALICIQSIDVSVSKPSPLSISVTWHEPFNLQCDRLDKDTTKEVLWTWTAFMNSSRVKPVLHDKMRKSINDSSLKYLPMKHHALKNNVTEYQVYCTAVDDRGKKKNSEPTVIYIQQKPGVLTVEDIISLDFGKIILFWTLSSTLSEPTSCNASFDGVHKFVKNLTLEPIGVGVKRQTIEGMNPSTAYIVTVLCRNSVGKSEESEPYFFITKEAAPTMGTTTTLPRTNRTTTLPRTNRTATPKLNITAAVNDELTVTGTVDFAVLVICLVFLILAIIVIMYLKRIVCRKILQMNIEGPQTANNVVSSQEHCEIPLLQQNSSNIVRNSKVESNHTLPDELISELDSVKLTHQQVTLKEIIGLGEFAGLYKGQFSPLESPDDTIEVAVKTLNIHGFEQGKYEQFVKDGLRMKGMDHPNVMKLIGICSPAESNTNFSNSKEDLRMSGLEIISPLVIVPYMPNGDLKSYLYDARLNNQTHEVGLEQLLQFAYDICCGMEYLAGKHIVHRGLSCRNCMLDANMNVIVYDLGFSRQTYSSSYIKNCDNKWMAPESLQDKVFTSMSDVWSFGVTAWELFTYCQDPYRDFEIHNISAALKDDLRLDKPIKCPSKIWDEAIYPCWNWAPEKRPTFTKLVEIFAEFKKLHRRKRLSHSSESHGSINNHSNIEDVVKYDSITQEDNKSSGNITSPGDCRPSGKIVPRRRSRCLRRNSRGGDIPVYYY